MKLLCYFKLFASLDFIQTQEFQVLRFSTIINKSDFQDAALWRILNSLDYDYDESVFYVKRSVLPEVSKFIKNALRLNGSGHKAIKF